MGKGFKVMRVRGVAAYLLALSICAATTHGSTASDLVPFVDSAAGVQVSIPGELVGRGKASTTGLNWKSDDEQLSVDTLRFPPERSLDDLRTRLKTRAGRHITHDLTLRSGFRLEGRDRDGSLFVLRIEEQPDGTKRGVSIVYFLHERPELRALARRMARSFKAAGGHIATPVNRPQEQPQCEQDRRTLAETVQRLQIVLPARKEIALGETIEVSWKGEPTLFSQFAGGRHVYLYMDVPEGTEVLGAEFGVIFHENRYDASKRSLLQPPLKSNKRVYVDLSQSGNDAGGRIGIRPSKQGVFSFSAGVGVDRSTSFSTTAGCDAIVLREQQPVTVVVKPAPLPFDKARSCHMARAGGRTTAPDVRVTATASLSKPARIGDAIQLRWSAHSAIDPACKTPLYLVFSMPERVRFSGDGFFALAPGAAGPFELMHDIDKMRVYVPLHIGEASRTGTVGLKI
jgi:hypothetical protein